MAKYVADTHNSHHYPLLIGGTAHYAKFAPDVLKAVHGSGDYSNMSPDSLLNSLRQLSAQPLMHGELEKCIARPVVHTNVCSPDVNNIINELYSFAERS